MLSVITALEFFQHYFAKMGHRNTSCDPHLHQVIEQPMLPTSREASAARAATSKRPCVDGLPACRGTGSYSEMGSEKFSNTAKSGYNKGTIRSDIRYLVVSKDVRRHRLISIVYIPT